MSFSSLVIAWRTLKCAQMSKHCFPHWFFEICSQKNISNPCMFVSVSVSRTGPCSLVSRNLTIYKIILRQSKRLIELCLLSFRPYDVITMPTATWYSKRRAWNENRARKAWDFFAVTSCADGDSTLRQKLINDQLKWLIVCADVSDPSSQHPVLENTRSQSVLVEPISLLLVPIHHFGCHFLKHL